jgi:hypothetical protein
LTLLLLQKSKPSETTKALEIRGPSYFGYFPQEGVAEARHSIDQGALASLSGCHWFGQAGESLLHALKLRCVSDQIAAVR